jgi:tetratricopeptide (TPR) repeat protein
VSFTKWFGRRSAGADAEGLSIDDLITLERWDEAEKHLKGILRKKPYDQRARLKLAEVFKNTGRMSEAVQEYLAVADRYAADGFHDKALALMAQATKLAPVAEKIWPKIQRVRRAKKLERYRTSIMEALLGRRRTSHGQTAISIQFDRLWESLSHCHLVDSLSVNQLHSLFRAFRVTQIGAGEVVVKQGQELEAMFFLAQGNIEIVTTLSGGTTPVLRVFEPGALFGERALFDRKPWPATYRTGERCVLLKLDREGLANALKGNDDPRGFLQALRESQLDSVVVNAVGSTTKT